MRGYHCYITNHCLLNVFLVYLNQTNGCYEYVYVMLNAVIIIPAAIISPPHGVTHENDHAMTDIPSNWSCAFNSFYRHVCVTVSEDHPFSKF